MPLYTKVSLPWVNIPLLIIGMVIIWQNSHSWWALLGGFIAALHFTYKKPTS